jgi:hypothetical protein
MSPRRTSDALQRAGGKARSALTEWGTFLAIATGWALAVFCAWCWADADHQLERCRRANRNAVELHRGAETALLRGAGILAAGDAVAWPDTTAECLTTRARFRSCTTLLGGPDADE